MANASEAVPEAYADVADALGAPVAGLPEAEAAALAAPAFDKWLRDVGLRIGLDDHGLSEADAERIAALCFEPENKMMLDTDSFAYTRDNLREAAARMLKAA
jgi:alcohol dehydrogenase class IV